VLVTAAVMLAVYAITGVGQAGWTSARTGGLLAAAAVLLAAFGIVESRTAAPLVPLHLLRLRPLAVASLTGVLWSAAMFACFFLTTLYLQFVLGYRPLETGLAFLPMNLIMSGLSAGVSARLVARLGIKPPLVAGLLVAAAGLALLGQAPVGGHFLTDVLPGGILLGTGAGIALAPLLLAATGAVPPSESGLASGIASTSFMLGGALGLAVLAGVATTRTSHLLAARHSRLTALTGGYHAAFLAGSACAAVGALAAAAWLRPVPRPAEPADPTESAELAEPAELAGAPAAEPALITAPGGQGHDVRQLPARPPATPGTW
jgi:hypothetical protein